MRKRGLSDAPENEVIQANMYVSTLPILSNTAVDALSRQLHIGLSAPSYESQASGGLVCMSMAGTKGALGTPKSEATLSAAYASDAFDVIHSPGAPEDALGFRTAGDVSAWFVLFRRTTEVRSRRRHLEE